jgi:hypothetical protein
VDSPPQMNSTCTSPPPMSTTSPKPIPSTKTIEPIGDKDDECCYQDDLTYKELLVFHCEQDPTTINIQPASGPIHDMSYLEQQAFTKIFDGATSIVLDISTYYLNLQSHHDFITLILMI